MANDSEQEYLIGGVTGKFEIWQSHAANENLVRAYISRRLKVRRSAGRHIIVLIDHVIHEQGEEWAGVRIINARWEKRLRAEADGAVGHRGSDGHLAQVRIAALGAIEIHHVARLGCRNIDAKNCSVRTASQWHDIPVEIGYRNDHARARSQRKPNGCARLIRGIFGGIENL